MKEELHCYRRVSSDVQVKEGNSLTVQLGLGKSVSEKLNMKHVDRSEGSKSSTTDYREVFEDIKQDIKKGIIKNLWVQDRSRLSREMIETMDFRVKYLEMYGVKLYEGENGRFVDFSDITDTEKMIYDITTRIHENQNKTNTERFQRGMKFKLRTLKEKGMFMGQTTLFGYTSVEDEFDGMKFRRWEIDTDEQFIVRQIFNMYENGSTIKDIKDTLDKEGVETRRTKSGLWNIETLRRMLSNKSYTGIHHVQLKSRIERETRNSMKKKGKSFTEIEKKCEQYLDDREHHNIKIPNIITTSQFNRVQKLLDRNRQSLDNNKKHETLLGDYLMCECSKIFGSRIKNYEKEKTKYYYCVSKNYSWKNSEKSKCVNTRNLDMDKTDQQVLSIIKDVISDSNLLKERFKTRVIGKKNSSKKELEEQREKIEKKIQRLQKEIDTIEDNIVDLTVSSGITKRDQNLVDKINKRYNNELELRFSEIKQSEEDLDDLDREDSWISWLDQYSDDIEIQTKDFKSQKDFLEQFIDSIVVKSEFGKNRDNKTKQIGHSFDINFKLKLVNDSLKYIDEKKKSKGYDLITGESVLKTDILDVGTNVGRKKKVKEDV